MQITLNGIEETVDEQGTLEGLLDRLDLQPVRVAVELNEDIVPRTRYANTKIQPGDQIEIVTFVGGG